VLTKLTNQQWSAWALPIYEVELLSYLLDIYIIDELKLLVRAVSNDSYS
jgi:hypothetical protein